MLLAVFGQMQLAGFLIDGEVTGFTDFLAVFHELAGQLRHQLIHFLIKLGAVFCSARDNQWGPRLINEDRIHFVDNGVV